MKVVSLNLRAMPNRNIAKLEPLGDLLDSFDPDLVMLQECRAGRLEYICTRVDLTGVRAHDLLGEVGGLPADGTAVAVRAPLRITHASTLAAEDFAPEAIHALIGPDTLARYPELPDALAARFRARSLVAEISGAGRPFAAGSFHATREPGATDQSQESSYMSTSRSFTAVLQSRSRV